MQELWDCSRALYELGPFPTALFDETGNMRNAKSKFSQQNYLTIEKSSRLAENDVYRVI